MLCFSFAGFAQNIKYNWAKGLGGPGLETGQSISVDDLGNIYTIGTFQGTVDFDPDTGVYVLNHPGMYASIFISKTDSIGNFVWAKKISANGGYGPSLALDAAGNVFITGYFYETVDFDPDTAVYNLTAAFNPLSTPDIFICKLYSDGGFAWARRIGGTAADIGNSIFVDSYGYIYSTGYFIDNVDFDPDTGTYYLSNNYATVFVSKLDSGGNFVWAKSMGGTQGNSICVDASGSVCTTGTFYAIADFDPGPAIFNLYDTTGGNSGNIFISKLDSGGNFVWAKSIGGQSYDQGRSVMTDAIGNVYTSGFFLGTVDFDPGADTFNLIGVGHDNFISKLDINGNFIWAKYFSGGLGGDFSSCIALDVNGNIYSIGDFMGTVDFNPVNGSYNLTSNGDYDIFISKLDSGGNFIWAKKMGGIMEDIGKSITTDNYGNVYATGFFADTANFNPGGVNNLVSNGNLDIFIAKYGPCNNTYSTQTVSSCYSYFWQSNILTVSGIYTVTIPNFDGCDSIMTLNLTIINNTASVQNISACESFTSPSGLYTWTSSGTFIDTIPNEAGCDSIITFFVSINTNLITISQTSCGSYISPSANYIWVTSGTYSDTILNTLGCDSIITINLIVNNNTDTTINPIACGSYISPSNNYLWTTSGTFMDTIPNLAGCDSIITINLTINSVDITVSQNGNVLTSNANGANYQWLFCDSVIISGETSQSFHATSNGNYAVIVTQTGCSDTSLCFVVINIGISAYSFGNDIKIYPNPTDGVLHVQLGKIYNHISTTVCNILGQEIETRQFISSNELLLSFEQYSGIYFLEIHTEEGHSAHFKVLKN